MTVCHTPFFCWPPLPTPLSDVCVCQQYEHCCATCLHLQMYIQWLKVRVESGVPRVTAVTANPSMSHKSYIAPRAWILLHQWSADCHPCIGRAEWAYILFVVFLSLGEMIWSPRWYDYSMSVAPGGAYSEFQSLQETLPAGINFWTCLPACLSLHAHTSEP